jgi:hypothetical protein
MNIEKTIRKIMIVDETSRYLFEPIITYKNKHYPKYLKEQKPKYLERFKSDNIKWMAKCNLIKFEL